MGLHMLKPGLGYLKGGLPLIERRAPGQVVARLTGNSLVAIRRRVFARCGGLCECGACPSGYPMKLSMRTMEADHITPLYLGGDNSISNFRGLHVDCHARVTAEQQAERLILDRDANRWNGNRR